MAPKTVMDDLLTTFGMYTIDEKLRTECFDALAAITVRADQKMVMFHAHCRGDETKQGVTLSKHGDFFSTVGCFEHHCHEKDSKSCCTQAASGTLIDSKTGERLFPVHPDSVGLSVKCLTASEASQHKVKETDHYGGILATSVFQGQIKEDEVALVWEYGR